MAVNFFPTFSSTAYLLVIHGSRDPRPSQAAQVLAQQIGRLLGENCLIESAALECAECPLHQQIMAVGDRALRLGCKALKIVPLFLLPGVHVREDIPDEVALAQQTLGRSLSIDILPYLGSYPGMVDLLMRRLKPLRSSVGVTTVADVSTLLLAHGSRRAGGNQPIETIASRLGATQAYWSVAPHFPDQIQILFEKGQTNIIVMPYFLFAGGITDAIAQRLDQLRDEYPSLTVILGEPLGAKADIAALIAQEIRAATAHTVRQEHQNLVTSATFKY